MKVKWLLTGMILFLISGISVMLFAAQKRDDQWKKVQQAMNKGLPKTAIENLEPIIEDALKNKDYADALKAITMKISLEGNIQGNKAEEKITRLEEAIKKVPEELVPLMETLLGHYYWHFFQQNRWRFMQRTATSDAPGKDILSWDLKRIFAEIDKHYSKALAAEKLLKSIPVTQFDKLLIKGTMPDAYRPTLYDFVAFEALNFYMTGEQAGTQAEDSFELDINSPILASVDEFVKWKPTTTDTTSPTLRAIQLFQQLLAFHKDDKDPTAFLDADLTRLTFCYNKVNAEGKNQKYKEALNRFLAAHEKHELFAMAKARLAGVAQTENDLVLAKKIAEEGKKAYPNSEGGKTCHNIIEGILQPSSTITTERVWNSPAPTIRLQYRNVNKVYFRLIPMDWEKRLDRQRYRPEYMSNPDRTQLLALKPVKEWSEELDPTDDYQPDTVDLKIPEGLKAGFYILVSSHDKAFSAGNNVVQFTDVWVSQLALVMRNSWGSGQLEGFVLDAVTGEPIEKANIRTWVRNNQNNSFAAGAKGETDKNGIFKINVENGRNTLLLAEHNGQQIASQMDLYIYNNDFRINSYSQTFFFTDRSIYRPGQTIQFKGICATIDGENDNYKVIPNQNMIVVFRDANNQEITRQTVRTNDYGSFAGSVTAPRDRLMGRMYLSLENGPNGQAWFNVEEYKRPKFQVTLDAPKDAAKLNEKTVLSGKATAYTGAAINGAKVRYRVTRQVRYPAWWYWAYWWRTPRTESQEIANGFATTEADGTFQITFVPKPDTSVPEKEEPTFHYTINAEVTDSNGETRTASRNINVGYTALKATLTAAEWQVADKEVTVSINTSSLDDVGQKADTKVQIFALKQPDQIVRPQLEQGGSYIPRTGRIRPKGKSKVDPKPIPDLSNPNSWPEADSVFDQAITTDDKGVGQFSVQLKPGIYRIKLQTKDRFGKAVTAQLPLQVLDLSAKKLNLKIPNLVAAPKWELQPGENFTAIWGSGYEKARAFIEVEHRNRTVQSFWTDSAATQVSLKQEVTEAMRGGFTLRVTMVRENRAYFTQRKVEVPWHNKDLTVKWEHFVNKLEPGKRETFTAVVTGPDAKKSIVEMVAGMYDASLDAYLPHGWMNRFGFFRQDQSRINLFFENTLKGFQFWHGGWSTNYQSVNITHRRFQDEITAYLYGYGWYNDTPGMPMAELGGGGGFAGGRMAPMAAMPKSEAKGEGSPMLRRGAVAEKADAPADKFDGAAEKSGNNSDGGGSVGGGWTTSLGNVSPRKNLNETAFFFPQLISDDSGTVKIEFTIPEALTEWKFLGFTHDTDLRSGFLQDKVITAKDLMIQPNAPRFLREGDLLEFTVKVTNQSDQKQIGNVRLNLSDLRTDKSVDDLVGNKNTDQAFELNAKESKSFSWKLSIPDSLGPIRYKAVGATAKLSDGEEGAIPVLSRRILVTESLPLPIRDAQTKTFNFAKLRDSGKSDSLQSQSLTVQMVSNPSWYAVMALPYLMEYPYECAEQTFNRLYANALAKHIVDSDPKIREIFNQWKGTDALDSPLEKNQDLKSVLLEETPWVRQAQKEKEARQNVGILFDDNRIQAEIAKAMNKLVQMQHADGLWGWFPGGRGNEYISMYIMTGFGRMRHLGVKVDTGPAIRSLEGIDAWINRIYQDILANKREKENNLSPMIAIYLYGRSFFLKDKPVPQPYEQAVKYFLGQAKEHWLKLGNRQSQAHLALALKRFGEANTPKDIMKSIKERSVSNEEMGMFWRDSELSYYWYRAPIETQAMMIEAFDEVMNDAQAVEDCKVWMLKQKQTQDWKTTKATADAVYGLLLRGDQLLKSDALVEVSLGAMKLQPAKVEAGTGFYEQKFLRSEVKPEMGNITVTKTDKGVSWGSVHWQYLEDMSKVTPHEGTPLKVTKKLYTKHYTKKGPELTPVKEAIQVGDELVVRIEIRVDRDMEYLHLKDYRGSGTEPVNVLSQYKFQDGLGYYESTRDAASHFFIDYLPKGTYVFEYSTRVVHKGQYQTGIADIQCMYAPEFNSHSESIPLKVE